MYERSHHLWPFSFTSPFLHLLHVLPLHQTEFDAKGDLTVDADHSVTGKNQARKIGLYRARGLVRKLTLFDFTGNVRRSDVLV